MTAGASEALVVGVVVPAHDEQETIARCVASVIAAARHADRLAQLWIVVVADDCADGTALRASQALGPHGEVVACRVRSAGLARRLGAEAVLRHFAALDPSSILLANTDADSHVAPNWLTVNLSLASDGTVGVAGIVTLDPDGAAELHEHFARHYRVADDGTHTHVHGANMAVRAHAYLDIGGWTELKLAEDHCLWNRLKARGWKLKSAVSSVVVTSGRLHGRAPGGFADTLRHGLEAAHVGT